MTTTQHQAAPSDAARTVPTRTGSTRRPRRRLLRRLGIVLTVFVVLLAGVVAAAPWAASTPAVTRFALGKVNGIVRGSFQLDRLALSWTGPTEIVGLRLTDPEQREVLAIDRVHCAAGLWKLITGWERFGDLTIHEPRASLYLDETDTPSIARALALREPSPPDADEGGPLPEIFGRLKLNEGSILVARDQRQYEITDLNCDLDVRTLADISGTLALSTIDGAKISGNVALQRLVTDGRILFRDAAGTVRLKTDRELNVAPLADLAAADLGLQALAHLDVDAQFADGGLRADLTTTLRGLQTKTRAAARAEPLDVTLAGKLHLTDERFTGQGRVSSEAGTVQADVAYVVSDRPLDLSLDRLLSAVLTGESVLLPDFSLDAQGSVDLAKLGRAVPELLTVHDGHQITGGRFEIANVALRGGQTPTAAGRITMQDVTAQGEQGTVRLEPIAVDFDAALRSGRGLEIAHSELKSGFAEITASGAASDLRAAFQCDLTRLRNELGKLLDLGVDDLAGTLSGTLQLARPSDERIDLTVQADINSVRYAKDETRFELARGTVRESGHFTLADNRVTRFDLRESAVDLDGQVRASAVAWFDLQREALHADLDVQQADLKFFTRRVDPQGTSDLSRYTGIVAMKAIVERDAADKPLQSTGTLLARDVTIDGRPLLEQEGRFAWSGVEVAPDASLVRVASAKLESSLASLDASDIRWQAGDAPLDLTADRLLAAVLTGEPVSLPDASLEIKNARVDLAALGRAMPDLLAIRPDRQITGGRVELAGLSVRGGESPAATGRLAMHDVAASGPDGALRLEPITLDFDAALRRGKGLDIARSELKSGFAQLTAGGAASDLRADFQCDLTRMRSEIGRLVDLGVDDLAGTVSGTIQFARQSDQRVDLTLQADVSGARYARGDTRFDLVRGTIREAGHITLADNRITRFDLRESTVDLDGQVRAAATGWFDLQRDALHADLNVQQADLAFIARRAAAFGATELSRYAGVLATQATLDRDGADRPLRSTGSLTARGIAVDGKPLIEQEARLNWSGVEVTSDATQIRVASARLESALAHLDANDFRWQAGDDLTLEGRVQASADLARCLRAVSLVNGDQQPPNVRGRLKWNTDLATARGAVNLAGQGTIDQLEIGAGNKTIRENSVRFAYDARLDQPQRKLTLSRCDLNSAPFSAQLTGTVDRYDTDCVLAVQGSYDAQWDNLVALLHELAPATAESITIRGRSSSRFQAAGPANQRTAQPPFRGMQTGLDVSWDAADLYGVKLGAARLAPALRDGQLIIPDTRIPATSGGAVNLAALVDFRGPDPTLRIDRRLVVLDKVPITPLLSNVVLSRVNPIFLFMSRVEGVATMHVQNLNLPFGDSIQTAGTGRGQLDLTTLQVQPMGILTDLLSLGGVIPQGLYSVRSDVVDFEVRNGRIHYDNFTLIFPPAIDLMFYGSVGFDDTLDLVVSLPLTPNVLSSIGLGHVIPGSPDLLKGLRVDIPMSGTRQNPRLDFARVDKSKILERLLVAPEKALDSVLKGLLGGGEKKSGSGASGSGGSGAEAAPKKDDTGAAKKGETKKEQKPRRPVRRFR